MALDSKINLTSGAIILAADDSAVARMMIEQGLQSMGVPYVMTKTGQVAWDQLQAISTKVTAERKSIHDKVALP